MRLFNKYGKEKELIIKNNRLIANKTDRIFFVCNKCGKESSKTASYFKSLEIDDLVCSKCNRKDTVLKKYGAEHISKVKAINQKKIKTCLEKYGVENVSQIKEIKEKKTKTCSKNNGFFYPQQSKKVREKTKKANLEKYGVENVSQIKEIKEKKNRIFYENFKKENDFVNQTKRVEEYVSPLFTKEEYFGLYKNGPIYYKWKCKKCGNEFEDNFFKKIPRCYRCFPGNTSFGEKEVLLYIKRINKLGEVLENRRDVISPYELDIYIPELKLAIEYNGDYWHNLEEHKKNDKIKQSLCKEKEIDLIYIWESDWKENKEEIKEYLKNILDTLIKENS